MPTRLYLLLSLVALFTAGLTGCKADTKIGESCNAIWECDPETCKTDDATCAFELEGICACKCDIDEDCDIENGETCYQFPDTTDEEGAVTYGARVCI